jgi:hypothetical protein
VTWFRKPNWLGETYRQEMGRRIEACESSVTEFKLEMNAINNRLLVAENRIQDLEAAQEAHLENEPHIYPDGSTA